MSASCLASAAASAALRDASARRFCSVCRQVQALVVASHLVLCGVAQGTVLLACCMQVLSACMLGSNVLGLSCPAGLLFLYVYTLMKLCLLLSGVLLCKCQAVASE